MAIEVQLIKILLNGVPEKNGLLQSRNARSTQHKNNSAFILKTILGKAPHRRVLLNCSQWSLTEQISKPKNISVQ